MELLRALVASIGACLFGALVISLWAPIVLATYAWDLQTLMFFIVVAGVMCLPVALIGRAMLWKFSAESAGNFAVLWAVAGTFPIIALWIPWKLAVAAAPVTLVAGALAGYAVYRFEKPAGQAG